MEDIIEELLDTIACNGRNRPVFHPVEAAVVSRRLEDLFAPHWPAILDYVEGLPRCFVREVGAGEQSTPLLVALAEALEAVPLRDLPDRWKQALFRIGVLEIDDLGFGVFEAEDEVVDEDCHAHRYRTMTCVQDECFDVIDRVRSGEETLAEARRWWAMWGKRRHRAAFAIEGARLSGKISSADIDRLEASFGSDFEDIVCQMEGLVEEFIGERADR